MIVHPVVITSFLSQIAKKKKKTFLIPESTKSPSVSPRIVQTLPEKISPRSRKFVERFSLVIGWKETVPGQQRGIIVRVDVLIRPRGCS